MDKIMNDIWGIDVTDLKMLYEPWPVDQNYKYRTPTEKETEEVYCKSGEAVKETLLYFEKCDGNTDKLIELLNSHVIDRRFIINRSMLLDESRWYNNEYYFYFIMFTKKIIGRYNFHFGENSNNKLSVYHSSYEKGFLEDQPWGKDENGKPIRDLSSVMLSYYYTYLQNNFGSEIISRYILYFNSVLRKYNKVIDLSYFYNNNFWISREFACFAHVILPVVTNDDKIYEKTTRVKTTEILSSVLLSMVTIKTVYKNVPKMAKKITNIAGYEIMQISGNSCTIKYFSNDPESKKSDKYYLNHIKADEQLVVGILKAIPTYRHNLPPAKYIPVYSRISGDDFFVGKFVWKNKATLFNLKEIIINIILASGILFSGFILKDKLILSLILIIISICYFFSKKIFQLKKVIKTIQDEFEEINKSKDTLTASLQSEMDTLEHKVVERTNELALANERLREIDKSKTSFFANISHELRTPLTLILGPLKSIVSGDNGKKIECDNKYIKLAIKNAGSLLRLINQLLDFTKIEAGKMNLNIEKTDISKLIKYYISAVESSCKYKKIKLSFKKSGINNKYLMLDRDLFEKAFFNLFSNAYKFTESGGEITIKLEERNNNFIISFIDTGIGIERDKLKTIFERFVQADNSSSRKYSGTGIGLSYTKEIIELHKGRITVQSSPGMGSAFMVYLPVLKDKSLTQESESAYNSIKEELLTDFDSHAANEVIDYGNRLYAKRILIVEDNKDLLDFLVSVLNKDYCIITAYNGKKALEKLKQIPAPDLIISDIMMPVMDGRLFFNSLKQSQYFNKIPFIFLTARTEKENKIESLKKGAADYLYKPFDKNELKAKIDSVFNTIDNQKDSFVSNIIKAVNDLDYRDKGKILDMKLRKYDISEKEKEIIESVIDGYQNKEISDQLNISINTLKKDIKKIYRKINVSSRNELINFLSS